MSEKRSRAAFAAELPPRTKASNYPEPFRSMMAGRTKTPLGDAFGLTSFGVNLTRLAPGGMSALMHAHTVQEEFVYVLSGSPTLVTESGETQLEPGMCIGFSAPHAEGHQLVNRSDAEVVLLEVGDRNEGDVVDYPNDDLRAELDDAGAWRFTRKDGTLY